MSTTHPFSNFCSGPHRFLGAFRDNILEFVQEFDNLGEFLHGMNVWRRQLTVKGQCVTVPLYITEEDVKKLSKRPTCDHCRITGWSKHLLCNRSYHVIIPPEEGWNNPIQNCVLDLQNHHVWVDSL
ncbi:PHD finger protein MALE MEIOCYTE DEATH 1-like [Pyrus x bretschneideri]|uniref:PHD finger protein MALE MEIOCYTE DEATH 1-like n=1 Tax=Pyrus x bretschneideri TaxID=225117 RepID=UPI00202FCB85|nr:PHD finger protein MALE MEIOCYTE DEATH 1-like [Pyrus x bretschneideri]